MTQQALDHDAPTAGASETDRFVDWIVSTRPDDHPAETHAFAKALLLKVVTSLVVGAGEPFGELVIAHARRAGGTPEAGVAGGGFRTSLEAAAYANGTIAHTPEMEDCFFRPENRETSSPVWMFPALLSTAEVLGSSGQDLVTAAIVSFDVASRLVRGAPGLGVQHGINTCTWWGVPATAAGVARLLGLDRAATANAVSIALSQSCGLGHQTGYDAHKLEAGHSCRAGISAALMARDGATGAPGFLEDLHLAFAVVRPDGTADPAATVRDLGRERSTIHQVEFKKYPGCGLLHASVDALSEILRTEGLSGDDVAAVETGVSRHTAEYCDRPHPATLDSARWSFSFALAEVLLHGRVGLRSFSDERSLDDPAHRAARDKVRVVVEPDLSTGFSGAHVTVHTRDGRTVERRIDTFRGHPDDPLAPDEVVAVLAPFLDEVATPAIRRRVVDLVMDLDRTDGIGELMHLVTTFRDPSPRR
jgi:2-methylcitrate dehydratase PrpD